MQRIQFYCLLSIVYCLLLTANAQNYQWAKSVGGGFTDAGFSIAIDDTGNVYVTGIFWGTADFDPGPGTANLTSAGNWDIFFAKYNSSGNYIWAKRLGGTSSDYGRSLALDDTGNVYITGYFRDTADFNPGPGTANLTSAGISDIFFAKYSSSGNYLWAKRLGGIWGDEGYSLALDDSGNVYVTGWFVSTADFDPGPDTANLTSVGSSDIFFAKYSSDSGNYIWAKRLGGGIGSNRGKSIAVDDTGNVYVTGDFGGTGDFDPDTGTASLTSAGDWDIFFAKYSSSGDYLWAKRLGDAFSDEGVSIALDGTGNVYVTGYFSAIPDFDPGPGTANLTSAGDWDIFFAKYSSSGNYLWAKRLGGTDYDEGYSIALDDTGNVYVAGNFSGTADFDPGPSTANLISAGLSDIFFAKYSSSGDYLWAKRVGDILGDGGRSIALDGMGNVYVTGSFEGTADFDPGPGIANLTSAGDVDIFFAKYDTATVPAIKPIDFLSHLNIYPNPNTGELIVEIDDLCQPVCEYELRLYNILGVEMLKLKISNQKSTIDLSRYAKGIYIIQLVSEGGVVNKRVIID